MEQMLGSSQLGSLHVVDAASGVLSLCQNDWITEQLKTLYLGLAKSAGVKTGLETP